MYEDDFEPEDQQPPDIRDRDIPGRGPSGGRRPRRSGGRTGGGDRRKSAQAPSAHVPRGKAEFPAQAKPARELLEEILSRMGVPHPEIEYVSRPEGEYLEVNGPDLAMLIGRHGNTLEAL